MRLPSTTTALSSHTTPAFSMSSLIADAGGALALENLGGNGHPPRMADERDRLPGLIDLARQPEHLVGAPELIRRKAAGDDQRVEVRGLDLIDVRVDRDRVAALPGVGFLAHSCNGRTGPLLLEADLRVPELEVLVQRSRENENAFAFERHARNLYLCVS